MSDPLSFLDTELDSLNVQGLLRANISLDGPPGPRVQRGGRTLVNFSSNDYLGLAFDPRVRHGAAAAALAFGGGAAASRLLGGDLPIHRELEAAIAELKGTAAALLFPSGLQANLGTIAALVGEGDAVFSDALNHASIIDGCRLARAQRYIYRHLDLDDLEGQLRQSAAERKLVISESLFSMDGDVAPLADLCALVERHGALLMIDEAHATGVHGDGAGLCRELGVADRVHVQMGTLGKALGAAGAYVAGERRLVEFLINKARSYIFTTAPAPASCGAALAAIAIVRSPEGTDLRATLKRSAARLASALRAAGLPLIGGERQLMAVRAGTPEQAVAASALLETRGFLVRAVRPPTVRAGTSRLRLCVSAGHAEAEIDALVCALGELLGPARRAVGSGLQSEVRATRAQELP